MRAQLFAASPSGVARMEKFDVRDDGKALGKSSLRRCARRVIRLSDCVSVGPAGAESCPKATAAFYLTTTEKSYVLAAEQRDEWIEQLCQLAFQVTPAPLAPAPASPGRGLRSPPSVSGHQASSAGQRQVPARHQRPHGGELPLLLAAGPYVRRRGRGGLGLGAAGLTPASLCSPSDRFPGAAAADGRGHPLRPPRALPAGRPAPQPDAEGRAVPAAPAHLALPLPPKIWPRSGACPSPSPCPVPAPTAAASPSPCPPTPQNVFSFEAGRRSDSGEGTFTFSTPRALELCRAVAAAIASQQQGKDAAEPQLSAQSLEPPPRGPGAKDPQPSPPVGRAQPGSHPPPPRLCFHPSEPEPPGPIVYASIARGQQPLFGPGRPAAGEPWAGGKPPPEHLYENIFTAEPGPPGAPPEEEEDDEEEEGRWELGSRQAPEGRSSEAAHVYDPRSSPAPRRGSPQPPPQQPWGRGAAEEPPGGRPGPKPPGNLRARLVRLLSREGPGPRDWL